MTRLPAWEAAKARLCSSARFGPACGPQRGLALVTASRKPQIHSGGFWAGTNKSTLAWTASAHRLTITLGQVPGTGPATVASSVATYTPATTALNPSGVPVGGTFATANVKQF